MTNEEKAMEIARSYPMPPSSITTSDAVAMIENGAYSTMPTQSEWKKQRKHSVSSLKTLATERCNVDGAMAAN